MKTFLKARRRGEAGFSLLELVITITIGSILLGALATLFITSARTNSVIGAAIQNQNSTRMVVTTIEKDMRNAAAVRVVSAASFTSPSGDNYYSWVDIKTNDGRCIRWTARPTTFTGTTLSNYVVDFNFKRQSRINGPILDTTPETRLSYPKDLTFVGIGNVFSENSLGYTTGIMYNFHAGLDSNRTLIRGTVFATSTPLAPSPCW